MVTTRLPFLTRAVAIQPPGSWYLEGVVCRRLQATPRSGESGRVLWRLEISSLVCLMVVAVPFVCIGFPESKANLRFNVGGIGGPVSGGGLTGGGRIVASGLLAEASIASVVQTRGDASPSMEALSVVEVRPLYDQMSYPGKAARQSSK